MSNSSYTAENIQHLETREAMRSRIQMYLGSDATEGIYQALKEIINNSTDEALAGYGKEIPLGTYPTKEEAFQAYKQGKEKVIKETIDSYEGIIPEPFYSKLKIAMYNYKVEITD